MRTYLSTLNFHRLKIPGKLYLILATQTNLAELLGKYITEQLKTIKRHNFFFNSLKKNLTLLIKQKFSKIKGIKILIKGRLNNASRSRTRIIKIGKIPIITKNMAIDYSESTAFKTSHGTIGIKIWINYVKAIFIEVTKSKRRTYEILPPIPSKKKEEEIPKSKLT